METHIGRIGQAGGAGRAAIDAGGLDRIDEGAVAGLVAELDFGPARIGFGGGSHGSAGWRIFHREALQIICLILAS